LKADAVLVTGADLPEAAIAQLQGYTLVYAGARPGEDDLLRLVQRHDPVGIIVRYGRITARIIESAQSLKAISKFGSGIDTIDVAAARGRGIAVKAAIGVNAASVAEHAIALMLACAKSIPHLNARMHGGYWDKATHRNIELRGRTLGLVGLGAIGNRVAEIAHALGMNVLGHDPYSQKASQAVQRVSLDEIWRSADVISFHCPLTDETRDLLDAAAVDRLKPGVIIVNTARGGVIEEQALLRGIEDGRISAAALDSFKQEPPPPDHPFFAQERIILSPHIGAVTAEAYINVGIAASRNLLDGLREAERAGAR
jgi:D-3-phosphoglycerate dehydrogenase